MSVSDRPYKTYKGGKVKPDKRGGSVAVPEAPPERRGAIELPAPGAPPPIEPPRFRWWKKGDGPGWRPTRREPRSFRFWTITILVIVLVLLLGWLTLGMLAGPVLYRRFAPVGLLLCAGLCSAVGLLVAASATGIKARIHIPDSMAARPQARLVTSAAVVGKLRKGCANRARDDSASEAEASGNRNSAATSPRPARQVTDKAANNMAAKRR